MGGSDWGDLGFQGKDPCTDFRGMVRTYNIGVLCDGLMG